MQVYENLEMCNKVNHLQESENKSIPEHLTLQVLDMLPTHTCVKPKQALSLMSQSEAHYGNAIIMDEEEFESETFQRVYQYLRLYALGSNLDIFSYAKGSIEGTSEHCLKILLE